MSQGQLGKHRLSDVETKIPPRDGGNDPRAPRRKPVNPQGPHCQGWQALQEPGWAEPTWAGLAVGPDQPQLFRGRRCQAESPGGQAPRSHWGPRAGTPHRAGSAVPAPALGCRNFTTIVG